MTYQFFLLFSQLWEKVTKREDLLMKSVQNVEIRPNIQMNKPVK